MTKGLRIADCVRRGLGPLMAAVALLMLVAAPPGFMINSSGQGPALVVCTGHGPLLTAKANLGHGGQAPKSRADNPCLFAGHMAAPAPSLTTLPVVTRVTYPARRIARLTDLAPGRGLAAPPPPSQGPPIQSI